MLHFLKIYKDYFTAVNADVKKAELRFNDRNYKVNDVLVLLECDEGKYTGSAVIRQVTHVLDCGLMGKSGWVILSIKPISGMDYCLYYDATKLPTR